MSNSPAEAQQPPRVLVELTISAPADVVWTALRDPVQINRWFGWDAATLEEEIRFIFVDHATADDAAMRVTFEGMPDVFEVERLDAGRTVVRLIRHGAAGDESDWNGVYEDVTEGWLAFLTQLRFALERHPGQERRTLFLAGAPAEGDAVLPRARLGVDRLADLAPGERYSLRLDSGETLTGEIWRRSRRQVAVTVDQYGDGLVLVTDRSAENQPPAGGGSVIVTTYGLAPREFAALCERWSQLWQQHFTGKTEMHPDGAPEEAASSS